MDTRRKIDSTFFIGMAALLAAIGFILTVFQLLSRTEMADSYLGRDAGWRYELFSGGVVRPYEPEIREHGYAPLPEGTRAVRATRVMTEQIPDAQLAWLRGKDGIEIFLDGERLYSDFYGLARDESGFVSPTVADWERLSSGQTETITETRMTLPSDYSGKKLSVTTYFPAGMDEELYPVYPSLGSPASSSAIYVVTSVKTNAVMTVYALMALLMVGFYLLNARNEHANGKLLLLCLFFLMLFLNEAYTSSAGFFSILTSRLDLRFLRWSYMVPLYLYLTLMLKRRWKWPLCAGVVVWALYETILEYWQINHVPEGTAGNVGWGGLAMTAVIAVAYLAERRGQGLHTRAEKKRMLFYWLIAGAWLTAFAVNRAVVWEGLGSYLRYGVWEALRVGNFEPLITPVNSGISFMTVTIAVTDTIRRAAQTRRTLDVLRERQRLTEKSYHQMEQLLRDTSLLRHEWKNQVAALRLLAEQGSFEELERTLVQMDGRLTRLSNMRYSDNFTANVILQNAATRAADLGVTFTASAPLPERLDVDESDLCSLLINMLDNALDAASKATGRRKVNVSLKVVRDILSIKCENSYSAPLQPDEDGGFVSTKPAPEEHGWGIRQMRQIAEKYNGILDITSTDSRFTIQTALSMRRE